MKESENHTGRVLCFGELLLRLAPDIKGKWILDHALPVHVGGAELNVASALANWEIPVSYFTALPENFLSKHILGSLGKRGIDTSPVIFSGDRIGIYYLAQGTDVKNAGVIYDRAGSSFSQLKKGQLDWNRILDGISWFHFSAICPALSMGLAEVCLEVLQVAKKKKITVSVDLNYRSKLWQYGTSPESIMPELVSFCDIVMGNIWAANSLLGIPVDKAIHEKGTKQDYLEHADRTSGFIMNQFPECKAVANTFRFDSGSDIKYYASLFSQDRSYVSNEYNTDHVVDKVGSGDCFMAGLIYGYSHKLDPQQVIDFAAAAAFNKLFIEGDSTTSSIENIKTHIQHG